MVKIILPLMSAEAHGSIIQGVIFATNQNGQYVKFYIAKKKVATPAQNAVRHTYGQVATLWRLLSPEQKRAYHTAAVRNQRTDYNEFFHQKWPEVYEP